MTKVELVKQSAHYFKNEETRLVYATSDGHFFMEKFSNDASNHIRGKDNMELFKITRSEALGGEAKEPAAKESTEPETSKEDQEIIDEIEKEEAEVKTETSDAPKPKVKPKNKK
jgi:hypothetical protein